MAYNLPSFLRDNSRYHDISGFLDDHRKITGRMYTIIAKMIADVCKTIKSSHDVYCKSLVTFCRFLKVSPPDSILRDDLKIYAFVSIQTAQIFLETTYMGDDFITDTARLDNEKLQEYQDFFYKTMALDVNVPSWLELVSHEKMSLDEFEKVKDIILHIVSDYMIVSKFSVYDLSMEVIRLIRSGESPISHLIWKSYKESTIETIPECSYNKAMISLVEGKGEVIQMTPTRVLEKPRFKIRDKMDFQEELGGGTFGTVYHYICDEGEFAVKVISNENMCEGLREVYILLHTDHLSIVKVTEYGLLEKSIYLMMPKAKSDLRLVRIPGRDKTIRYMKKILEGLEYLHSLGISHRDLKPGNILVYEGNGGEDIKICDFGLSRHLSRDGSKTSVTGTLWYRAIDVLLDNPRYDEKIDIWAAGCVFYYLLKGTDLFKGESEIEQIFKIFKVLGTPTEGFLTTLPDYKSSFPKYDKVKLEDDLPQAGKEVLSLLEDMLAYNPDDRIPASKALENEIFKM